MHHLNYTQDVHGDCTGILCVNEGSDEEAMRFERLPYKDMLRAVSARLQGVTPSQLTILFKQSNGAQSSALMSVGWVDQLQRNPEAVVTTMCLPDIRMDMRPPRSGQMVVQIVCGIDARAHMFGKTVYIRRWGERVESPYGGRWEALCGVHHVTAHWSEVAVADLLASGHNKFYLPQAWNASRPWITKESLAQKLDDFLRVERELCSVQVQRLRAQTRYANKASR